jgi:hypothetical protein
MSDIKSIKQRFGIIGVSPLLDRALEKAVQVAPTDISVLVTGESGVGKEKHSEDYSRAQPQKTQSIHRSKLWCHSRRNDRFRTVSVMKKVPLLERLERVKDILKRPMPVLSF